MRRKDSYRIPEGRKSVEVRNYGGKREKYKLISDGWDSCWEDKMYSR